jgi:hypothetical protein
MFHSRGREIDSKTGNSIDGYSSGRQGGHGISWWLVLGVLLINGLPETYSLAELEQMYSTSTITSKKSNSLGIVSYRISLQ